MSNILARDSTPTEHYRPINSARIPDTTRSPSVKVAIGLPTSYGVGEETKKKPTTYQVYGKPCIDRLSFFVDNMARVLLKSRKQTTRGPR
ncbi:hypothetical protein CONPUDRAFT_90970 [Coniophora puteana RWD-64-598 SS2]|uniref:Uncharacterized protein n=1 Tax=Coniophora puteana (strain RWD-64-598) TaxID=741705 RepID=A0A5M3MKL3_CONPW|nr:uncharacterized protein CONPUDRAFT_90970 [Coniophora puteana RWD-64-598 SS2]EIW79623.1 hypothetical protein CONPUDRAFT_90970 [Coniophora puteana RWD-64-598 SS2]